MKLFAFERSWAAAMLDAVFPEGTALPHGIARMDPGRFVESVIAASPLEQSLGLRLTLWLVALAPLWLLRRPATITTLAPHERQRILERLLTSPVYAIRQLALALKAVGSMLYARSAAVRAAITTPHTADVGASGLVTLRRGRSLSASSVRRGLHGHAAE